MFADTTLKHLRKLKDGNDNYIFQASTIALGTPAQLLDMPYSINDDWPALGAANDAIAFGDFSRFWVRVVGAPTVYVARERFLPDIGLLGLIRLDGELVDSAAIKVLTCAAA
jgi:HK97 family phage major capsid protein